MPAQSALYISGTASIRASESQRLDDPVGQAELSIDNLRKVTAAAGMPQRLGPADPNLRIARVYVRHPQQWPLMASTVESELFGGQTLQAEQQFNVIEAPICRQDLLVEIEAFVDTKHL